jgi:uncharacterized membrane protein
MTLATIVDTSDLLEVIWVSSLAGVGVTVAYGLALLGVDRTIEFARAGRGLEAIAYGVLAVLASAVVTASLVFGLIVMFAK